MADEQPLQAHLRCGAHDNRRQTERNKACFNCQGAKEEKQSLKEPYAKENGTAQCPLAGIRL